MARAGYRVRALDIAHAPTLEFLRWRLKKHQVEAETIEFENPVPPNLPETADGLVMISVFDHVWDPQGLLDWIDRNIRRGGWMLCDTFYSLKSDDEPQHIIRYNPHRIGHDLRRRGWVNAPDNPLLFVKEK
jgi:2-polyprenyl-3-methyl-5-hydroxy-6-metoxy-1,4-benzoquinol methylase